MLSRDSAPIDAWGHDIDYQNSECEEANAALQAGFRRMYRPIHVFGSGFDEFRCAAERAILGADYRESLAGFLAERLSEVPG